MIRQLAGVAKVAQKRVVALQCRSFSALPETEEWALFPREQEGNIYAVNWSMCEDGVTPVGNAYQNARLDLLTKTAGAKVQKGVMKLEKPAYFGKYTVDESGDGISHETFGELFEAQTQHLSSGIDLFVEDASLGAFNGVRNGVRVITDDAAVALIARSLLIPTPPKEVNHRARFKGWNFDPRWASNKPIWNEAQQTYDLPSDLEKVAAPGERPVVAFVGGPGDKAAVQFVENDEEIVGANVVVGGAVPVRGLVDAVGHATTVLLNQQHESAVALACTTLAVGKETAVVIGANDAFVQASAEAGSLFGAYHNMLSPKGVSALWNGYVGTAPSGGSSSSVPTVVVGDKAAVAVRPNNLAFAATHVVFYEEGATKSKLSADEAAKKIVAMTDDSKADIIKSLLKGASVSVIGKVADLKSIF